MENAQCLTHPKHSTHLGTSLPFPFSSLTSRTRLFPRLRIRSVLNLVLVVLRRCSLMLRLGVELSLRSLGLLLVLLDLRFRRRKSDAFALGLQLLVLFLPLLLLNLVLLLPRRLVHIGCLPGLFALPIVTHVKLLPLYFVRNSFRFPYLRQVFLRVWRKRRSVS